MILDTNPFLVSSPEANLNKKSFQISQINKNIRTEPSWLRDVERQTCRYAILIIQSSAVKVISGWNSLFIKSQAKLNIRLNVLQLKSLYTGGGLGKMKVNDPGRKLVIYTQGKNNLELLAPNMRCRAIFWILLAWRKGDFVAANERCRAVFRLIQAWRTEPPVALILGIHYEKEEELYIYSVWTTASLKEETAGSSPAWQTRP